jgi:hypothetical protein
LWYVSHSPAQGAFRIGMEACLACICMRACTRMRSTSAYTCVLRVPACNLCLLHSTRDVEMSTNNQQGWSWDTKRTTILGRKRAQILPRSMGLLGVARANTAVGVSPETFLLLLLQKPHTSTGDCSEVTRIWQTHTLESPGDRKHFLFAIAVK